MSSSDLEETGSAFNINKWGTNDNDNTPVLIRKRITFFIKNVFPEENMTFIILLSWKGYAIYGQMKDK